MQTTAVSVSINVTIQHAKLLRYVLNSKFPVQHHG